MVQIVESKRKKFRTIDRTIEKARSNGQEAMKTWTF